MSQEKIDQALQILQKINDAQNTALERQARQLEISEILLARTEQQYENANKITSRAEALQDKGAKAIRFLMVFAVLAISLLVLARFL